MAAMKACVLPQVLGRDIAYELIPSLQRRTLHARLAQVCLHSLPSCMFTRTSDACSTYSHHRLLLHVIWKLLVCNAMQISSCQSEA